MTVKHKACLENFLRHLIYVSSIFLNVVGASDVNFEFSIEALKLNLQVKLSSAI